MMPNAVSLHDAECSVAAGVRCRIQSFCRCCRISLNTMLLLLLLLLLLWLVVLITVFLFLLLHGAELSKLLHGDVLNII